MRRYPECFLIAVKIVLKTFPQFSAPRIVLLNVAPMRSHFLTSIVFLWGNSAIAPPKYTHQLHLKRKN